MHLTSMRFLMGTFLSVSALLAMEPPDPGMIETYSKDGTLPQKIAFAKAMGNHTVGNGLAERSHYKLKKLAMDKGLLPKGILPAPPDAWRDMPTTGNVKVLTILIDFSDNPHNTVKNSQAQVQDRIFGDGDAEVPAPYESFKAFYERSSYNKLHFEGNVLGWYRAGYTRASMAQTTLGREQLIKEALTKFETDGHDFSQYDNNGDGAIDFFSVIWTGADNGWANFWWGYQTSFTDEVFKLDGKSLGKYSWQWESRYRLVPGGTVFYDGPFSPKTLIHEQGHGLGLPDYYDYDDAVGPRGGIGGLDMMDWVGDHNCYSKWLLDWIQPTIINTELMTSATVNLRDAATHEDALLVMPGVNASDFGSAGGSQPFGEFFMVQNRQLTGNDLFRDDYIDGSGLLIWHVDSRLDAENFDYRYDNSYTEHKLLRLMEADGLEQLEDPVPVYSPDADAGDFYAAGAELGTATTPNSARYDGTWTDFGIDTISVSGPTMTFNIYTQAPDATPPTGTPSTPSGVATVDQVQFTWGLGTALESAPGQIIGYYLQVGSTAGGADVFDGRVGSVTTQNLTGMGRWDGHSLYARVRAMNTAGLFTAWSGNSAGVSINLPAFAGCADLDNCDLVFKSVGSALPWSADATDFKTGASSAAATCDDNDQTYVQTTVTGPGDLTFWWKASTEKDFDYYSLLVDGVLSERLSGDVAWTQKTLAIPAGSHVVAWRWAKDGNTGGTVDKVWLDDVQFTKSRDLNGDGTLDILDLAQMAWAFGSSSADANWSAAADLNNDGIVNDADITLFLNASGF